jgi:pyruvate/2-oxoglutarate dehydrogenase complex dihydrolipoamide acyltransferase (E2) component
MIEQLNEAYEELKRVDHLIYVSLKYTRTVDVILNILNRSVDAYALMVNALILYAKEQGKISQEPESAVERAELVKELFGSDEAVVDNMQLYLLERKLLRARNVERENEYRRHVTMKTVIEGREEIVNIDIITNYFLYQREFLAHVRTIIEGKAGMELREQQMQAPTAPAWMDARAEIRDDEDEEEERKSAPSRPEPKPQKVRPVSAPARKRAPRPKKYKVQIPKGKNPILRVPFEHDPRYAKQREAAKKAKEDRIAAEEKARKAALRPKPSPKKTAAKKPVQKKPSKAVKKKR